MSIHRPKIIAVPDSLSFLYPVELRVIEDDTYQILAARPEVKECGDSYPSLIGEALEAIPIPAGSLLQKGGTRRSLVAIVYDLDQDPICNPEWIRTALRETFNLVRSRSIRSIAIPALGTTHSRLDPEIFLDFLRQQLTVLKLNRLELVVLLTSVRKPSTALVPFTQY